MFGTEILGLRVLERVPPELPLFAVLASLDRSRLRGFDRVEVLKARARLVAALQAEFYADMVAVAEAEEVGPEGLEFVSAEVGAALAWSRRAADNHLDLAYQLQALPQVWEALHAGLIDLAKARVIVCGLEGVEEEVARRVADQVLDKASRQTTGQIAASIRRLLIAIDPEAARGRYEKSVSDRRVELGANPEGTANLYGLSLPADRANQVMARIDHLARLAKTGHDERTIDQVRADVFLDLLEGRAELSGGGRRGVVDLVVDLATLAGLSEDPGEIPGWGPVIGDIARQLAADQEEAEWRFTVTEPGSGEVVGNGVTRRRPSAALQRRVQARRRRCVFPGCRMPAVGSDLDHTRDWAKGGKTREDNLAPLCRYHHRLKHEGRWQLQRIQTGQYIWTSPLGQQYTIQPQGP